MYKNLLTLVFFVLYLQSFSQNKLPDSILTNDDMNWLKKHKNELTYAPNPSWPPGDYIDDNGEHKGIVSDYIKIFESALDLKFKKVYFRNWNEIYNGLLNNQVDFVGAMMITDERQDLFNFTDVFLKVPLVILVRNDYSEGFSVNQIKSMKIASVKGYITQNYVSRTFNPANIKEFDNDLTALLQTSLGNTDGTIVDLMTASFLVEKYGINNLNIGTDLDFTWELRFAFRKDQAVFATIINKVLKTIDEEQRLEIYHKWVNINTIAKPNFFEKNSKALVSTGILLLLIIILFFNYTIILKKQVKKRTQQLDNELNEKTKAINLSKKNESRLESLFEISKYQTKTIESLLDYSLSKAVILTESKTGLLLKFHKQNQTFTVNNYFNTEYGQQIPPELKKVFTRDELGNCLNGLLDQSGYRIGACEKCRYNQEICSLYQLKLSHNLVVPVIEDNDFEAVLILANKNSNYDNADAKQMILLMNSVWKLLSKQKWQEQLIIAKEKAEESDRLKSAFLANMSHEIRTPMNAIIGFSECLTDKNIDEDKKQHFASIIQERTYDLLRILEDILDVSRIEVGQLKILEKEFVVSVLMNDLYEEYDQKIKNSPSKSAISLKLTMANELGNIYVKTDIQRLKQVLTNLLDNALKFTHQGSIEFGCISDSDSSLIFFVKDTGLGIPEDKQEIIFDRFRQADESLAGRLYGGTGLGLSIAKGILNLLNGKIWLESKPNEGTTFYFKIPLQLAGKNQK
ncbi:MAG TPA: transporter substrate-binding domain-containing protein [Prolixibacteraceae bacterium]|nr:transporter substrate-binding domain-containing protein [Prolixibacteraceae bacterium]